MASGLNGFGIAGTAVVNIAIGAALMASEMAVPHANGFTGFEEGAPQPNDFTLQQYVDDSCRVDEEAVPVAIRKQFTFSQPRPNEQSGLQCTLYARGQHRFMVWITEQDYNTLEKAHLVYPLFGYQPARKELPRLSWSAR